MCGMTREQDVLHAASLGADAIGLIFYSKSARCVSIQQAKQLLQKLPPFVNVVAVFVNPLAVSVDEVINELPIDYLQFHGEETPEFCEQFNKPFIKAVQVTSKSIIQQHDVAYSNASAILLDSPAVNEYGGTGKVFDWQLIPEKLTKPIILAGGLNHLTINFALKEYSPYAVDLCSGIELSPGIKDHDKMSLFVNSLREKND